MIHEGLKVLDEPMAGLRRRFDPRKLWLEPLDVHADVSGVRMLSQVERVEPAGDGYQIVLTEGSDPAAAIPLVAAACPPARIEINRLRLEDVFIGIVSDGSATGDGRAKLRAALQAPGPEGATV
jgi:hypothetical protein